MILGHLEEARVRVMVICRHSVCAPPYRSMSACGDDPHYEFPRTVVLEDRPLASYLQTHRFPGEKGCFEHESQMPIALLGAQWKADGDVIYNF